MLSDIRIVVPDGVTSAIAPMESQCFARLKVEHQRARGGFGNGKVIAEVCYGVN
jgi:hypothetical protein